VYPSPGQWSAGGRSFCALTPPCKTLCGFVARSFAFPSLSPLDSSHHMECICRYLSHHRGRIPGVDAAPSHCPQVDPIPAPAATALALLITSSVPSPSKAHPTITYPPMAPRRISPASETPSPSPRDRENKETMREVAAAAAAALGLDGGAIDDSALERASHVASQTAGAFGGRIAGQVSSSTPSMPQDDDHDLGFMAYQSMQHHAAVARRQAATQLDADQPPSPDPATLPFPSFLTQALRPRGGASMPHPGALSTPTAVPRTTPAPGGSTPTAVSRPTTSPPRTPSAVAGSGRCAANPGIGSKPFTSDRARAAAAKRWSAAAERRRGKAVLSIASLPGAAAVGASPSVGEVAALAGHISLGADNAGTTMAINSAPVGVTPIAQAVAAAHAMTAAKSANKARTVAVTKASMAARAAAKAAQVPNAASEHLEVGRNAAGSGSKVFAAGNAPGGPGASASGKTPGGSRALIGGKAPGGGARGGSKASGAGAPGQGKVPAGGKAPGGGKAVEIVLGAEEELQQLKRDVAELLKLKSELTNLKASLEVNTEVLETHGHSIETLATSFSNLKVELRGSCKPFTQASSGSNPDKDNDDEPPARKRVRFASDVRAAPPVHKTASRRTAPSQSSWAPVDDDLQVDGDLPPPPPVHGNAPPPPPVHGNVPPPPPVHGNVPPPPPVHGSVPPPPPVHGNVPPPPPVHGNVPPPAPVQGDWPLLEGLAPRHSARFDSSANEARRMTAAPSSRLRRPTPRVGDVETRAEAQARRRAEGTVVMQGIRGLLNPRVTKLVALAVVSRDVFLDPETKFEMIVDNAMEYMDVSADEANVFLLEMIEQPTKKRTRGNFFPKAVRACAPLGMVFSHMMWAIKSVVVAAWFSVAAKSAPAIMAANTAKGWKLNHRYGQTDGGRAGIVEAAKRMFIYLNARHRIKEPTESGQMVTVHATMGHYGMICTFVAEALEVVATGVKGSGPDGDRFKRYVAEMVSLDKYLPKDSAEHNGLVIVDGADPNRAHFPEAYMPDLETDEGGAAGNLAQAAAAVA